MKYDFATIETRWQQNWAQQRTFHAANPGEEGFDPDQPKYYVLDMFPYPSGVGLHVGHPLGYIATDIVARFMRMKGFNVLHPMGFDAFGLPAEQFAVEHGVHPRVTTEQNIQNMVRQLKQLGLSYDWDRQVSTTDVEYYRWTQWIFLQLYHSWVDESTGKARPIRELVQALEAETVYVAPDGSLVYSDMEGLDALAGSPIGARKWYELSEEEQQDILDTHRLAYLDEVPVNWCPALGIVLANEEVTAEGRSERGNHPVYKRPLRQWMLRITAMADRLAGDLDHVDWPESIKLLQRNWIGKSYGAYVEFPIAPSGHTHLSGYASSEAQDTIRVYTTRPDTLFGCTYMVLAPEHPLVDAVTTPEQREAVRTYQRQAARKAEVDRQTDNKAKTGVFTGGYAINPVNDQRVPIWIADYVLMGYGTGAIMAVPAQDQRDWDFATAHDLAIVRTVQPPADFDGEAYTGDGPAINSDFLDGLHIVDAKRRMIAHLEAHGCGEGAVQYKLRDWLFSRQRYWGEPFPILHELDDAGKPTGRIEAVDEADLPVALPEMDDFRPAASDDPDAPPAPPLSRAPESWRIVEKDGRRYARELNTMPQWAGSCWYYLRFCDPTNTERFVGKDAEDYWMVSLKKDGSPHTGGVDLYVGGVEHAVLHLLYARFWHKVLYDLGHVSTPEPFGRLYNQGYIQAYAYTDDRGIYVDAAKVEERDGGWFFEGKPVKREFGKMGKSLRNAIAPDEVCEQYGCDTLRLYEMYMGPLDQSKIWNTRDIIGVHRFLQRVWRNFISEETGALLISDDEPTEAVNRKLHHTIRRVSDAMNHLSFNTAIAALIELNNDLVALPTVPRVVAEPLVLMLSPMAPHIAEELWQRLGHTETLSREPWPQFDEAVLVEDSVELPVQINGKVRSKITVAADADDDAVEAAARADEKIASMLEGKAIRKVIVIKGRLVNIVAG